MNGGKIVVLAGCMLLAGLSTARADSFMLNINNYSYGNGSEDGGEFTAFTSSNNFLSNYAPTATLNLNGKLGFETFCVQPTVFIDTDTNYSYTLAQQDGAGQPLSLGTAFLYYEFGTGKLTGYDYTDPITRNTDAGELQAAIWALQSQTGVPGGWPSLTSDPFYALAIAQFGNLTNALDPNNDTYGVDILQLSNANGPAQNQLVLNPTLGSSPVPEAGATTTMLAFACFVLLLLRRHIQRDLRHVLR